MANMAASDEPKLSQAELRRRRILAKKGARMALVTGDQTLAATDNKAPPVISSAAAVPELKTSTSTPSSGSVSIPNSQSILPSAAERDPVPTRAWYFPQFPVVARASLVAFCGLSVPAIRAQLWDRAPALHLFVALQALFVAPELASRTEAGILHAVVAAARQLAAIWRDAVLFLFALFIALRATYQR